MLWFLLIFFSFYTLMHIYIFHTKIRPILPEKLRKFLPLLMLILIISPVFMRYADTYASSQMSYVVALMVLLWMGFLIYLVFFSLLWDTFKVFVKRVFLKNPSKGKDVYILLLISLFFSIYSYLETKKLEVIHIKVETCKIPEGIKKLKILQISDLHLGPLMGIDKINLIKEVREKEKPDIVVSTGDLVDGNMGKRNEYAEKLKELKAPLGIYAILGNHEYYRGVKQAIEFIEKAGFTLLRNEVIDVKNILYIVGLDDKTCKFFSACDIAFDEVKFLEKIPQDRFVLILKHQPKIKKEAIGLFDLMLSGHTHGGLYKYVGAFIMQKIYETDRGLKPLGKGSYLFVSKGVGTGGPPMRFLIPPDVAVIEILNCKK
ncbi:MAG: metallophosphoesterase [Thermodesulfobacterium geofontis]|uniref:Metallophosphoesterase n=1 Tax=Thermodesulfobacterium geofontis TaxID=1295609 RepID=A0A2N7QFV7_9BACT|nr:MAG: metallophosphoesterase [Thermodesulfobacterium geofontis]